MHRPTHPNKPLGPSARRLSFLTTLHVSSGQALLLLLCLPIMFLSRVKGVEKGRGQPSLSHQSAGPSSIYVDQPRSRARLEFHMPSWRGWQSNAQSTHSLPLSTGLLHTMLEAGPEPRGVEERER